MDRIPIIPDEHVRFGNAIRSCRNMLLDVLVLAPAETPMHRDARCSLFALDRLRAELEMNLVQAVRPCSDPRKLLPAIYGGAKPLEWTGLNVDARMHDVFASWREER